MGAPVSNYYIDWTDVSDRYADAAKIGAEGKLSDAFIRYAEAEVDARLAPVYATPFSPGSSSAPLAVRDLCIDLSYYKMVWRQEGSEKLLAAIDARFERILKGQEMLTTSEGLVATVGAGAGAWSSTQDYHSRFGPDDPTNWAVSDNELTDAEDDRL